MSYIGFGLNLTQAPATTQKETQKQTQKLATIQGQNLEQAQIQKTTQCQNMAQKDQVASVTSLELNQLWSTLTQCQDISYSCAEEEELDFQNEIDDEEHMDSELPWADEDALDTFDGDESDDDTPNLFFLNVSVDTEGKAHCTAPDFDAYLSATPLTRLGQNCHYELSSRGETMKKLAQWLEENRQSFLKTRSIADLGEKAWDEYNAEKFPILQKELATILNVKETTFCKHIKNIALKWDGIMVPLDILFSKEAKVAWAVAAYKQMPEKPDQERNDILKVIAKKSEVNVETIKKSI